MTAEYASAIRALGSYESSVKCPDYLAKDLIANQLKLFISKPMRKFTKSQLQKRFPHLYPFHIVRNLHIDTLLVDLLEKKEIEQVIFLGAGFDTRAIRFAKKFNHISFFELDFPETQELKQRRLEKLKRHKDIDDSHITYIPIDFNKQSPFEKLEEYHYNSSKRSLVIWEGVTMYLPEKTITGMLTDINMKTASGSYLTFDYLSPETVCVNNEYSGNYMKKINEEYLFGIKPNELSKYVSPYGYETVENYTPNDLNSKYLDVVSESGLRNGLSEDASPSIALLKTA